MSAVTELHGSLVGMLPKAGKSRKDAQSCCGSFPFGIAVKTRGAEASFSLPSPFVLLICLSVCACAGLAPLARLFICLFRVNPFICHLGRFTFTPKSGKGVPFEWGRAYFPACRCLWAHLVLAVLLGTPQGVERACKYAASTQHIVGICSTLGY